VGKEYGSSILLCRAGYPMVLSPIQGLIVGANCPAGEGPHGSHTLYQQHVRPCTLLLVSLLHA
jgi:hypothetical protein